ncbi:MAG: hypothetical protein LBN38_08200, partial [Verrucomicrobiota bacterium]|nr:hypothetical protein [Verrucomicrobiota bacterium]
MKILYWILSGFFSISSYAAPTIKNYNDTCAAKLFNEPHYNEIFHSGSPLVDEIIADARREGWPLPAIFTVPKEYQKAKEFLTYLTNRYPASVAAFIPTDCNSNVAQAVWASVLENYQDGGS